jgi:DNA-binding LytR/AlgR family response regulator
MKNDDKYVVRGNLNEYLGKLSDSFLRIHRSYVVNMDYLKKVNQSTIDVGIEIPIGKALRGELISRLNKG